MMIQKRSFAVSLHSRTVRLESRKWKNKTIVVDFYLITSLAVVVTVTAAPDYFFVFLKVMQNFMPL